MIRPATLEDVPTIVAMARQFYPETHYVNWCDMDDGTVADLAANLAENHVMLVAELDGRIVGMVGLFIGPFLFNRDRLGAYEVVWWVAPEARGSRVAASLLTAIEAPSRDKGASRIQMVHMPNSPPQAAALYERFGYALSEVSYTKDINRDR